MKIGIPINLGAYRTRIGVTSSGDIGTVSYITKCSFEALPWWVQHCILVWLPNNCEDPPSIFLHRWLLAGSLFGYVLSILHRIEPQCGKLRSAVPCQDKWTLYRLSSLLVCQHSRTSFANSYRTHIFAQILSTVLCLEETEAKPGYYLVCSLFRRVGRIRSKMYSTHTWNILRHYIVPAIPCCVGLQRPARNITKNLTFQPSFISETRKPILVPIAASIAILRTVGPYLS